MPRVAGVSITSTEWFVHLRPSPRTVALWLTLALWELLKSLTRIFFVSAIWGFLLSFLDSRFHHLFDGHPAFGRDVRRGAAILEGVDRRPDEVVGVGRAVALRQHVRHTDDLEHRAHRS